MKKFYIIGLLLSTLLTAQVAFADFKVYRSVNIREQPNTQSPVTDQVIAGDILLDLKKTVNSNDRDWYFVQTPNGIRGYVAAELVDIMQFSDKNIPVSKTVTNRKANAGNTSVISGNELHRVNISLKDLNRITCATKISDPIYSRDKEIEIVRGGDKDLFVKISPVQIIQDGETEIKFNTFEREVFVECGGVIYSLTLIPKETLATQTIVIKSSMEAQQAARTIERSSNYEKLIADLIKFAYNEHTPNGYTMKKGKISYKFEEMDMRLRYQYIGFDYVVEDWELRSKIDSLVELEENTFVPILKNARAITFVTPKLSKDETTRMLVVRLNSGEI